jgi:hypothetical protein
VFGITHHGSVAEELVFLGIPVLASTRAPWTDSYQFVRTWRSVHEYGDMLDGLAYDCCEPVTAAEKLELLRFTCEYRLGEAQKPGTR